MKDLNQAVEKDDRTDRSKERKFCEKQTGPTWNENHVMLLGRHVPNARYSSNIEHALSVQQCYCSEWVLLF